MTRIPKSQAARDRQAATAEAFRNNLDDPRHGTPTAYRNYNCRCPKCSAANSRSHYEYMHDPEHPERLIKHRTSVAKARAAAKTSA